MGVRGVARHRLARWAAQRPHVLLIPAPGGTEQRLAVEAHVHATGGVLAQAPADTDLLVVAGTPAAQLGEAVDRVWAQVPAPRVRLQVADPASAGAVLEAGVRQLVDRPVPDAAHGEHAGHHARGEQRSARTHGGHEQHGKRPAHDQHGEHHSRHSGPGADGGNDEGHASHAGHEGHGGHKGHGGMQMPGGLMMADRAPDRDGLKLDVLHVPLGPVLPAWPAGLVVDTVLQGDLLQGATARVLATPEDGRVGFWASPTPARRAAAHLDSLSRLLELAGWSAAAAQARRHRDQLLTATADETHVQRQAFARWRRRVERSRGLHRSLRGLGRLDGEDVDRLGLSGPAARATARGGDAWARLVTWLAETAAALDGAPVAPGESSRGTPGTASGALLRAAVELMPGLDLAGARLVMASLDPDTDEAWAT